MKIRLATNADQICWDAYVAAHPDATPYHRFAWGQACHDAYQLPQIYLIAEDENGVVRGVLPCIKLQRPFAQPHYCSLPYSDSGNALADDQATLTALLEHLLKLASINSKRALDYRQVSSTVASVESLTAGQKVAMKLPLPATSEALMNSFKSKLRSQIRKAEKNGLTVTVSENANQHAEVVEAFYHVYQRNMRNLASPVHSLNWFKAILSAYDDNAKVGIVYHQDQPVGGGIVIMNGKTGAIPWASTLPEFNRLAPNMLLYWGLLAATTDAGMQTFDFGRSSAGEGTFKFKAQWGAQPYPLQWSDGINQNSTTSSGAPSGTIRQLAESIWPRLPLSVTVALGSAIRRYISL